MNLYKHVRQRVGSEMSGQFDIQINVITKNTEYCYAGKTRQLSHRDVPIQQYSPHAVERIIERT